MHTGTSHPAAREAGNALVAVLVAAVSVSGLLYAALTTTTVDLRNSSRSIDDVRTSALAQAGIERALEELRAAGRKYDIINPLQGIRTLFASGPYVPFVATPLVVGGKNFGEFTVTVTAVVDTPESMELTIDSTGYYPVAPVHLAPGIPAPRHKSLRVSVQVGLEQSKVFDNGYFINNWGWFYGSNMVCNGNARSNGQFDVAGHAPTITGQPTYDSLTWAGGTATLSGYRDDNEDGLDDGNDGGIFAGWDITGVTNVNGNGGLVGNQHDYQDQVAMPNLSDLTAYEQRAIVSGGTVSVSGIPLFTGVYGDDSGEKQNLYLVGTPTDPIRIDGTVVVRGSVVLAGVVTGQGAIYAGGNVYVPNDLTYADPPTTARPADNTQAATQAWLTANRTKDFVAVLSRESIVLGDHTDYDWRTSVDGWLSHSMNQSKEDAGEDGIPNTSLGKDGIAGTEDDDVIEGDSVFSVETYTAADEALGLIPPGLTVGSVIPGSGEDIDGDGAFDDALTVADLDLPAPLDTYDWGGTISGPVTYSSIASKAMTRLDGVFYTNHAFAWMTTPTQPIHVNGSVVSRNESIIYGGPSLNFNYDCRLLGGSSSVIGDMLPRVLTALEVRGWMVLDEDPNLAISL
jgi:hypothetical protein